MAPPVASSDGPSALLEGGEKEPSSSLFDSARIQLTRSIVLDDDMPLITRRSPVAARGMKHGPGPIAGIVVGCIAAVALACLCLYPFIIRRIKRKKRLAATQPDAEVAQVPVADNPFEEAAATNQGSDTHPSSRDSLSNKNEPFTGDAKGTDKDESSPKTAAQAPTSPVHEQPLERGASVDHESILQRNYSLLGRRDSEVSTGTHPRWNTQGPPPISTSGIELSSTRADGLEYSEAMAGQSASYYSPTVPSEAFGMATPPQNDEPQFSAAPARTTSRASSLKQNLLAMMRRVSSKETDKASPSPAVDTSAGPWLPPQRQGTTRGELSESPVVHDGPSFRDFGYPPSQPNRLASPVALPMSPASTAGTPGHDEGTPEPTRSMASDRSTPPVLPPSSPAPGTVNPMDIMRPSNQSEQVWHTDRELFYLDNPHVSPPRKTATPPPIDDEPPLKEVVQAPTPASAEEPQIAIKTEPGQAPEAPHTPGTLPSQDIHMADVSTKYDYSHLTPAQHGRNSSISTSLDGSDRSDHSTPLPSHFSSGPSQHNTPNTQMTDISPSPRSDADIRNASSPYAGAGTSPHVYTCDQCQRPFDQIHKLNHHRRYHDRPHECPHGNCDKRFGTKTHLDRHINDKHKKTRKFHCLQPGCPYSRAGGKGFPRKDNWRRHMINKHGMNPALDPEPDVVDDETMTGV